MDDSSRLWILKRRHEDLSQTFRTSWDLYIKFYTVFLTFSLVGLGWLLAVPAGVAFVPQAKQVIATVFLLQTFLVAVTSAAMALYSVGVVKIQERIERLLLGEAAQTPPSGTSAVPVLLAQWAGWANCAAMAIMAGLWLYVGFVR